MMAAAHPTALVAFVLVFARVGGAIAGAPILSEKAIPTLAKIGFAALIAALLTPDQAAAPGVVPTDPVGFAIALGEQVALGLAFALIFAAFFSAAEAAGELIGQQMGVTLGSWANSDSTQNHTLGELYRLIAGIVFLGLDGVHWVVLGLGASFQAMPITRVSLTPGLVATLLALGGAAIGYAVGLALPLLATLLLADVITGLLGRALPSLNIFVLGLPLKVGFGLVGTLIALPFTLTLLAQTFAHLPGLNLWR